MKHITKISAVILVVATLCSFSGCLKYTSNILEITTRPHAATEERTTTILITDNQPVVNTTVSSEVQTTQPVVEITTAPGQQEVTTAPAQQEATTQYSVKDPSTWTTLEILKFTADAVNNTKAYNQKITVDHEEAFDVRVTKAPGGALIMNTADKIIASVAKPSKETLTFTNGRATDADGENMPLLLPKRGEFALTADGVAKAYAKKNGNDTIVHITLKKEVGTLTDHPKHHAASVGYLDAADVDLSGITLNYLNITYTGSTIDMVINSDGYVSSVNYKIPIHIGVEAKLMGVTVEGECEGSQSETWKINW